MINLETYRTIQSYKHLGLSQAITFFNGSRNLVFITNREISPGKRPARTSPLMQTLTDHITIGSQGLRLTK